MRVSMTNEVQSFRDPEQFRLADLEAVRLMLRGDSVIDWYRLSFETRAQAEAFLAVQGFRWEEAEDRRRIRALQDKAARYLKLQFDFPIPRPVAEADIIELLLVASGKGHRQLCACSILKVVHIIHHLDARELLFMLPTSDHEAFQLVEQKVYRVVGGMLAAGMPVMEFLGGRKDTYSVYTKLLSKSETVAARIYDKLRFRLVVQEKGDLIATLRYLSLHVFPFNYVIPRESKNTLVDLEACCQRSPHLRAMHEQLQQLRCDTSDTVVENQFSAHAYRTLHVVVDIPVRLPIELQMRVPDAVQALGPVIFVQAELQMTDRQTELDNEEGEASHDAYKVRQKAAVMRRLKLGAALSTSELMRGDSEGGRDDEAGRDDASGDRSGS